MNVTIPGALADHLATVEHDLDLDTVLDLSEGRRGRGRTLVITPRSTTVLHILSRYAEQLLATRGTSRALRDAARLWIKRAGHAPKVVAHRFDSTGEAYNASQCLGCIHDGDLLIVEREHVVAFVRQAWPIAITAVHGELHTTAADPRTLDGGRYVASVEAAEQVAREHGFPLAAEQAEAVEGTWRGEWIGQQADDGLFAVELSTDQGALFDDRAAVETTEQQSDRPLAEGEVTRASLDTYLARTYPALFTPEHPQPLALPPAQMWAVEHRVVLRGEWQGLAMCGLSWKEANDRADVLRATGSKAVEVVPCSHGPNSHPEERRAARCQGCGYRVASGRDWHDVCKPRPRRARESLRAAAEQTRARVEKPLAPAAEYDDEPPF